MNRKTTVILIVILAVILLPVIIALFIGALMLVAKSGAPSGGQVGVIRVEGIITSGRGSAGFLGDGVAGSEHIVKLLEKFRNDDSVKSLVLRVNSPGGSPAGSQEIYQEILRVRKSGKHVIVSMGDVAASGGYYISSAADKIYADSASLTGSIGVIMETSDIHKLLEKVGVNMGAIKSGKYKDMGSISRPMTTEEKKLLQGIIDDTYDQFVTDVSAGRGIPKDELKKIADGRVFTGRQAVRYKLVDKLGTLEDAYKAAAIAAGIKGEFTVKEYEESTGLFDLLFGSSDTSTRIAIPSKTSSLRELAQRLFSIDSNLSLR